MAMSAVQYHNARGVFSRNYSCGMWINKMQPTHPNAHTYVNGTDGTDVKTHGYAVTHNTFLQ